MKVDKGMTCGFEENIRRVLIDAEQKLVVDPKEKPMPAKNIQKAKFLSRYEYRNFNDDIVELEYEYRGHKYTVEEIGARAMSLYLGSIEMRKQELIV